MVERIKMKKVFAILLTLSLLIPFGNLVLSQENQKELKAKESEVLNFAKDFVDKTYKSLRPMEFQELSEKYLKPGNELFNTEMEVRNAVDHSTVRDFKEDGLEITLFEHEFQKVELKEKLGNIYRVELAFDESWDTSEYNNDSKDPERTPQGMARQVMVTVEDESGRLYITDLFGLNDGISSRLNKDLEEAKPLKEEAFKSFKKASSKTEYYLNALEPNGISPKRSSDETEGEVKEKTYTSIEELKNAQLENLANIREELVAPPAMNLYDDNTNRI